MSDNELDDGERGRPDPSDSKALLARLGGHPSAVRAAEEYIEEGLSADLLVLDREKWEGIPQDAKTELIVGKHLGRGSFSDVFEVVASVMVTGERAPTRQSFGADSE